VRLKRVLVEIERQKNIRLKST